MATITRSVAGLSLALALACTCACGSRTAEGTGGTSGAVSTHPSGTAPASPGSATTAPTSAPAASPSSVDATGPYGTAASGKCTWFETARLTALSPQLEGLNDGELITRAPTERINAIRRECRWLKDGTSTVRSNTLTFPSAEEATAYWQKTGGPSSTPVPGIGDDAKAVAIEFDSTRQQEVSSRHGAHLSIVSVNYDPDQPRSMKGQVEPLAALLKELVGQAP